MGEAVARFAVDIPDLERVVLPPPGPIMDTVAGQGHYSAGVFHCRDAGQWHLSHKFVETLVGDEVDGDVGDDGGTLEPLLPDYKSGALGECRLGAPSTAHQPHGVFILVQVVVNQLALAVVVFLTHERACCPH